MTAVVVPRSTGPWRGGKDVVAAEPWSLEANWNWNEIMSREWTSCGWWSLGYGACLIVLSYRINHVHCQNISVKNQASCHQELKVMRLAGVSNIDEEEEYLRNGAQVLWKQLHPPGDKNESLSIERIFFSRWIDIHTNLQSRWYRLDDSWRRLTTPKTWRRSTEHSDDGGSVIHLHHQRKEESILCFFLLIIYSIHHCHHRFKQQWWGVVGFFFSALESVL